MLKVISALLLLIHVMLLAATEMELQGKFNVLRDSPEYYRHLYLDLPCLTSLSMIWRMWQSVPLLSLHMTPEVGPGSYTQCQGYNTDSLEDWADNFV